jgi:recombination protein RecA
MDKQKALDAALAQIDRAFGKGSAMKLGSREAIQIEAISTGSLGLDIALGIGGLPRGRVVEVYGPESSGKTTLALHVIAEAQRNGGTAAFVDAEHALDPVYAKKLGVDVDNLIVSQPDTGEQALRSPTRWSAPTPSTSWSSIRWPRWCRGPRSKARWATAMSASRRV